MSAVGNLDVQHAIRRASVAAARARSVLGTQPWRIVRRRDTLEIHADRTRQLHALDPDGRQLVFSCGSAVANAVVSLTADGVATAVRRLPDRHRPDLLADVRAEAAVSVVDAAAATVLTSGIDLAEAGRPRLPELALPFAETANVRAVPTSKLTGICAIARRADERLLANSST